MEAGFHHSVRPFQQHCRHSTAGSRLIKCPGIFTCGFLDLAFIDGRSFFKHSLSIMKKTTCLTLPLICLLLGATVRADTLELKNGAVLQGKYLGGTSDTVSFETSTGIQVFAFSEVKNMNASPASSSPAARPVPAAPTTVVLASGTRFMVTMMDSVSSKSAPGTNFTTKLAYDLVSADGVVAVKAGTVIYGRVESATQAGRLVGQSTLDIRLTQIVLDGTPIPILTSSYAQMGKHEGAESVGAAGVGAIIGNNTGNGSQGKGAAYGLAVAALRPGQTLTVPPGALVEFSLRQSVSFSLGH
jgi:hypothetical protein